MRKRHILLAAAAVLFAVSSECGAFNFKVTEVETEWELANYQNPESANLTVLVPEGMKEARKAQVDIHHWADFVMDSTVICSKTFKIKEGENTCKFDGIGNLPAGRYLAVITIAGKQYQRMLRIDRVPEIGPATEPICVKKVYFTPDEYLFEKRKNMPVEVFQPELTEVYRTTNSNHPGAFSIHPYFCDFYRTVDGKYYMTFQELNYHSGYVFSPDSHPVTLEADNVMGPYTEIDSIPAGTVFEPGPEPSTERVMKQAKLPHFWIGDLQKKKYDMYDPEKHGPYDVSDLIILRHLWGSYDYSFGGTRERTLYCMVRLPETGEDVFLTDKPLFYDMSNYPEQLFDNGFFTNDNGGNNWITEDGKARYHIHGQTVHRFPPYDSKFDVLPNSNRLATLYSTEDGLNWTYHNVCMPLQDPFEQHYGMGVSKLKDSDVYLFTDCAYNSQYQQIYRQIGYGRDPYHGHNFENSPHQSRCKIGESFYNDYFSAQGYQVGNDVYQMIFATTNPHNLAECLFRCPDIKECTPEFVHTVFDGRDFERLGYFEEVGGWEGFAKLCREGYYAVGISKSRAGGAFGINAGDKTGEFTTREMTGGSKLYANVDVAPDGMMKLTVLTPSGKKIASYNVTGDDTKLFICDLPEGSNYKINVKARRTKLYSFTIE